MSWKITLPPTQSVGRSVMRIENEDSGAAVELRGPEGALLELGGLLGAGEAALDRARHHLAVGKVAYHVVYCGPKVGIESATVQLAAPGIRTAADVARVKASIDQTTGSTVTVISWQELELVPEIEIAHSLPVGLPSPANMVS